MATMNNWNSDKRSEAFKTKMKLQEMGVKSPKTNEAIEIAKGLSIVPKVKFNNDIERNMWIERMRVKYLGK